MSIQQHTQPVVQGSRHAFERLPLELTISIFGHLNSLSDAFALAATCRSMNGIWTKNLAHIYRFLGPRVVQCERDARILRGIQSGIPIQGFDVSVDDVRHISRNAQMAEKAVLIFERDVSCEAIR
ncbi:hypothetical protein BT63DRAFT_430164, partial [Microthyrium microscopicum]